MTPDELMDKAIAITKVGIGSNQSPFGCAIWWDGKLASFAHNTVVMSTDITAHAEVNALRIACRAMNEILLPGAIVATTCEPCPMCMAALHWARVEKVYYGATIADATDAGFNELNVPAADLLRQGESEVQLEGPFRREECKELFSIWQRDAKRTLY